MNNNHWPDFEESMHYSKAYQNERAQKENWNLLKDRYNHHKKITPKEQKIPKIIHQIWIGNELPEQEKKLTTQIKENLDPSWQYYFWTQNDLHRLSNFKNYKLFNETPNNGQKSDLLRYAILNEYGGIYLDTDFIPVKPFDDLLYLDFFCGISFDTVPNVFNGLIGSSQNNPLIKDLLELDKPLQYSDAMSLMDSTGPFFLTRKLFNNLELMQDLIAFPNSFFYPFPNFLKFRTLGNNYLEYVKPETYCIHLWSSRWN
jgi:mannosyltransferase OCH1-like enzyme